MRYGFVVPYADTRDFASIAVLGEEHGWDGVFTWEALWGVHAWVSLGAASMVTSRIRLGTLLTPVARWKPWDLASAVGTVDRLSGGRVVLSAGLGAVHEGWTAFEPDEGRRVRAEKLDECLAIYDGLMRGQPFSYDGRHYSARPTDFMVPDPPVQQPHPPVWMVGAHVVGRDQQPSLDRAARWDGLLPQVIDADGARHVRSPEELADLVNQVNSRRAALAGLAGASYDIIIEADSTGEFVTLTPSAPDAWAAAGATWWIESWWSLPRNPEGRSELERRVRSGPPGLRWARAAARHRLSRPPADSRLAGRKHGWVRGGSRTVLPLSGPARIAGTARRTLSRAERQSGPPGLGRGNGDEPPASLERDRGASL